MWFPRTVQGTPDVWDGGQWVWCLKTTLNYADGSTEITELHADDWFRDPADASWQFADVRLLINGMDRLDGDASNFADTNDPAVNEDRAPVNPDKVLESVTLELDPERSASNPDSICMISGRIRRMTQPRFRCGCFTETRISITG